MKSQAVLRRFGDRKFLIQRPQLQVPPPVLCIRDVEGAEGGAKHGSEANPGTSPTAKRQRTRYALFTVEKTPALSRAGMPKKKLRKY